MLNLTQNKRKSMPFLISDYGAYRGDIEIYGRTSTPKVESESKSRKSVETGKQLTEEYLKLTEQIQKQKVKLNDLEQKREIILSKINNNPVLVEMLNELLQDDSKNKTR